MNKQDTQVNNSTIQIKNLIFKSGKTFEYSIHTHLKETNAYGNIYFSRHFEWQGILRETWFTDCIFENMMNLDGSFVTKRATTEYLSNTYPFQKIIGLLNTSRIKKSSFDLLFVFKDIKTNSVISRGSQTITFVNQKNKIIKLPYDILESVKLYEKK